MCGDSVYHCSTGYKWRDLATTTLSMVSYKQSTPNGWLKLYIVA